MSGLRSFLREKGALLLSLVLLAALTACAVLYAQAHLFPPEREALLTASGACRVAESRTVYELYLEGGDGTGESYKLDDRLAPNAGQLIRDIEQGSWAELLYVDNDERTVMELTVDGEVLLTYDRASAMWYQETTRKVGIALLAVCGALLALGIAAAAAYRDLRRKNEREHAAAEKAEAACRRQLAGVRYSVGERQALEAYVNDALGAVSRIYYELDTDVPRIDLAVCEPSAGRPLYTLTTLGMGAFRMRVSREDEEKNQAFAEFTLLVPARWSFAEETWPLTMLKEAAHSFADEPWEGAPQAGDTYRCSAAVREASGFAAVLIIPAAVREGNNSRVMIQGGRIVNFYQLVPIYETELKYVRVRGASFPLWRRMAARVIGTFVQPGRECCVDLETWLDEDLAPFCFGENAARGEYYLELSDLTYLADRFAACGVAPSGTLWERIARAFLDEVDWWGEGDPEFLSTAEQLFIECDDELPLRRFALRLRELCEDEAAFTELLKRSKEENDGT